MAPGGGWEEAVEANKEKGFYNHSAVAITKNGPLYCLWELKGGISVAEFQLFIDGPGARGLDKMH